MQRLFSTGAITFLFCFTFLFSQTATAQLVDKSCNFFTPVAKECVGECGNPGIINYNVGPLCSSFVENFCVTNEGSNLCPSHDALAFVFVNNVLVATGDITNVGSSVSFQAPCNSQIQVIVVAQPNLSGSLCVKLGSLGFYLRRQ
ncbi:MAG: hypothetical protein ACFB10_10550 [Salibacteraceae bacterium]